MSIEADTPRLSFARTLLQFFVIPMLVVAISVLVFFVGFSWLVSDDTEAGDHLSRLRTGGQRERRQAAFELANRIQHGERAEFAALAPELVDAFEEATRPEDAFVRQYLVLALGRLAEVSAEPVLIAALRDQDPTVRVYAAWALGAIATPGAAAALAAASQAEDAGLRTMAVYGLGAIGDPAAGAALLRAAEDPVLDVSVNAVIALARIGDPGAEDRLLGMMEPDYWARIPGMAGGERTLARMSVVQAAAALDTPAVRAALEEVGSTDPDLRIREAALSALRGGPESPLPR